MTPDISGQGPGLGQREAMGAQRDSQIGKDTRRIGSQDPKTSLSPKQATPLPHAARAVIRPSGC